MTLMSKPDKDSTSMNIDANLLNKILENWIKYDTQKW